MTASTPQRTIGTHDGTFHCDEVLACYMLKTHVSEFTNARIVRSRDPAVLETADIVVDVGAVYNPAIRRFDHHQRGFTSTFADTGKRSRTKLSSAGLIYKHYGLEVIKDVAKGAGHDLSSRDVHSVYLKIYDAFMEAIDAIDNGITMYESALPPRYESSTDLSARVGKLNAEWYEANPDQDANFLKAIAMAGAEMESSILHVIKSWLPARSIVSKAMKERFERHASGAVMVMTEWAPWKDHLFAMEGDEQEAGVDKPVQYVVYKDMTGSSWRIQCVPVAKGSFQSRKPLPESWRGLRDNELSDLTKIEQCVFVHAAGFIGGNRTFEGAVEMAMKAMDMS